MTQGDPSAQPIVEIRNATKLYGGVPAVRGVSLALMAGEVHGLLGENGAGKSTLTKSLAGVVELNEGEIFVDGVLVRPAKPREALALGIAMVFQESSLCPTTTVAQNLYLGHENFYNRVRNVNIAAQEVLQMLNFDVNPAAIVGNLGSAKKQMVEIARAVLHDAKAIIFDEPTTSLTPVEKEHFFKLLKLLKSQGVAIVFITHAIEDALEHCDRITILRDGQHVTTGNTADFDIASVVKAMIGRDLRQTMYGQERTGFRKPGKRVLALHNLQASTFSTAKVKNNSFSVFDSQITGVFGLVGAGRTETFRVVAGLAKRNARDGGEILLNGEPVRFASAAEAVRNGVAYITEDRKVEGFFSTMDSARNIYIGLLAKLRRRNNWLSRGAEQAIGKTWIQRLNIRSVSKDAKVVELSGGNQQKVVIARSLVQDPSLIIFDEPTRGVDVGAIAEIHQLINGLADEGKAVVVISSYLPELLSLSDRILVARSGKVVEEFSGAEATEENIIYAAIH